MEHPVKFNPFEPEFHRDPYPTYHYLRETQPIHWSFLGGWVLTRYADIKFVLGDPRFLSLPIPQGLAQKSQYLQKKQKNLDAIAQIGSNFLFFVDNTDHTRLRRLIGKVFSAERIGQIIPQIQQIADDLIDRVQPQGQMDAVADFAEQLPGRVIAQIMGLPAEDWESLHEWSHDLFRIFDPFMPLKICDRMNQAALEFTAYLRLQLAQRRQTPSSDLISALMTVQEQGDRLSEEEVIAVCIMMFIAAEQTTISLIGNSLLALLRHPDQLALLRQRPELMPQALEELTRYDSPAQIIGRKASETMTLGDQTIEAGQALMLCLGAANRDPAQFSDPDQLNIARTENRHLAFSGGSHFCIGAGLARIEFSIALQTLIQRLPTFQINSDQLAQLAWKENVVLRSLQSLPITFSTRS